MKHVMSISIEPETIVKIREILRKGNFRNKSHVVEEAVRKFFEKNHSGEQK